MLSPTLPASLTQFRGLLRGPLLATPYNGFFSESNPSPVNYRIRMTIHAENYRSSEFELLQPCGLEGGGGGDGRYILPIVSKVNFCSSSLHFQILSISSP